MERVAFEKSLKNIPIPNRDSYMKLLLAKTGDFIERMRWKVHFFLNPKVGTENLETFGFNTTKSAPQCKEIANFESDLIDLVSNVKFKEGHPNKFQKELLKDVKEIKNSKDIFFLADKTTNIYKVSPETYKQLLTENITKDYKKVAETMVKETNLEAKEITTKLKIADRVEAMSEKKAYITLKDHKENFQNSPKCRLINPAKSELGKISKLKLEKANSEIREKLKLNQWRGTQEVLKWFKSINLKDQKRFLQFDVVEFYPSISKDLLTKALDFAKIIVPTQIDESTRELIIHARKAFLFSDNPGTGEKKTVPWAKKSGVFDVTMGAPDGAEICELVGLFLLDSLSKRLPELNIGLYRDDGLAVHGKIPGPRLDAIRKQIHSFFAENGLRVTVDIGLTTVNFLDVTFNLKNNSFAPFKKPNDTPLYVHVHSNHPQNVKKEIPLSINKRLCTISSSKQAFDEAKSTYQKSLKESGYKHELSFDESHKEPNRAQSETLKKKKKRRNTIWFNPPFNANVATNIGKKFLMLLDHHFPVNHPLRKCLNRNCVKISYCCTTNMKQIILSHNKKIMQELEEVNQTDTATSTKQVCNCRKSCPLGGQCRTGPIVYQVTTGHGEEEACPKKTYVGSTQNFKERLANHKASFKSENLKNATALSKYVWEKDLGPNPNLNWTILRKTNIYSKGEKYCDLCLSEKLCILKQINNPNSLNKRTEITNKCSHMMRYRLNRLK